MEENGFDFWQDHSLHYLEMALSMDKREIIENPDGYGKRTGNCGDTVEIFLTVRGGYVQSISYDTDGCINTNACCNTVVRLVEGKTIKEAWQITPDDVVDFLETLPPENTHCAELAVGAFYLAMANYNELKKTTWKKLYQGVKFI
jgi:nitrogen fixation NifU-like protein